MPGYANLNAVTILVFVSPQEKICVICLRCQIKKLSLLELGQSICKKRNPWKVQWNQTDLARDSLWKQKIYPRALSVASSMLPNSPLRLLRCFSSSSAFAVFTCQAMQELVSVKVRFASRTAFFVGLHTGIHCQVVLSPMYTAACRCKDCTIVVVAN